VITEIDLAILDWIWENLRCGFLDAVMPVITLFAHHGIFWICLSLLLLAIPKTRKVGLAMCLALVMNVLLCNVLIKPLVARPRPWTHRPELEAAIAALSILPTDFSFPSGHTSASFACAMAMARSKSRLGVPALILAALIGLSRLYLYVHYPTDVLCGVLLGAACGILGAYFANIVYKSFKNRRN